MAIKLTDKKVNSLKVSGKTGDGKPRDRQDFMDAVVPSFGVRVTNKGQRTYMLAGRFPGSAHYTRRELGKVGAMSLAEARAKARHWIALADIDSRTHPKSISARSSQHRLSRSRHMLLPTIHLQFRIPYVASSRSPSHEPAPSPRSTRFCCLRLRVQWTLLHRERFVV